MTEVLIRTHLSSDPDDPTEGLFWHTDRGEVRLDRLDGPINRMLTFLIGVKTDAKLLDLAAESQKTADKWSSVDGDGLDELYENLEKEAADAKEEVEAQGSGEGSGERSSGG